MNSRNGPGDRGQQWLHRAQTLAGQAERIAPNLNIAGAVGKYLAAARTQLEDTEITDDPGQMLQIAWLLLERGRSNQAVRYATRAISKLSDPFAGLPQIITDLSERLELSGAVRAGLHALIAVDAADRGDLPAAGAAANAILEASSVWPGSRPRRPV